MMTKKSIKSFIPTCQQIDVVPKKKRSFTSSILHFFNKKIKFNKSKNSEKLKKSYSDNMSIVKCSSIDTSSNLNIHSKTEACLHLEKMQAILGKR